MIMSLLHLPVKQDVVSEVKLLGHHQTQIAGRVKDRTASVMKNEVVTVPTIITCCGPKSCKSNLLMKWLSFVLAMVHVLQMVVPVGAQAPYLVWMEHAGDVNSVAWSPDGTKLASGSDDNTIRIWDVVTGQLLLTLMGHTGDVYSVSWSPDGTQLASASRDYTVRIWNATTGQWLRTLTGHTNYVYSVAWNPDVGTQLLASGSWDDTIRIWDAGTGQSLRTLVGHTSDVETVAWSPDGSQLASGSYDDTIRIWNTTTGQSLRTLEDHTSYVFSVAWSPDGTKLASGSYDDTIRIWQESSTAAEPSLHTTTTTTTLVGHTSWVYSVAWNPKKDRTMQLLASGSGDTTIRIWNVSSGQSLLTLTTGGHTSSIKSVAWSPDGTQLASGSFDNTIRLWNLSALPDPNIGGGSSSSSDGVSVVGSIGIQLQVLSLLLLLHWCYLT